MRIIEADVMDGLAQLDDGSVHCVVTSPPYWGLRNYGVAGQIGLEATPELYVERMVTVFREVRRVLADDGTLWLNMGDCYSGSGRTSPGLKPKDLVGIPWWVAFALRADGWWLRSDIIWSKPNPMPESVTDRPTRAHEYVFLLSKAARYYYDADAIREPLASGPSDLRKMLESKERIGGRYKDSEDPLMMASSKTNIGRKRAVGGVYKSGNKERKMGGNGRIDTHMGSAFPWEDVGLGRNKRSVWTIATQPSPLPHYATFPEALVRPCILAGSREGDTVLDPFAGSGTVGIVAQKAGRSAVLIDVNPAYCQMMRDRLAQAALL